jgi:hypothetical protein
MATEPISLQSPMSAGLENFPGAQRALFRRYHIGGVQQLRVSADGNFVGSLRATVADRHRMDYRRKIAALEISVKGKQLTKAVRL